MFLRIWTLSILSIVILTSAAHAQIPSDSMMGVTVGDEVCWTFTIHVDVKSPDSTTSIGLPHFTMADKSFTLTTIPGLPGQFHAGDSIICTICFTAGDTLSHIDTLIIPIGSGDTNFVVSASGVTPIIYAYDHDFGSIPVGTMSAPYGIQISNIGNAALVITKAWVLQNFSTEFSFLDDSRLPITVLPGENTRLNFVFAPTTASCPAYNRMDWGTNIRAPFEHHEKDTTMLLGCAIQPGLNWDRRTEGFMVECDTYDTMRVNLVNPSSGSMGTDIEVDSITIGGPNAAEFKMIGNQYGTNMPWLLGNGSTAWVDLQFKVDLSLGYTQRTAWISVSGKDASERQYMDMMQLRGVVRHTTLSITPASYGFGVLQAGQTDQTTFTLTNTGDTTLIFTNLNFLNEQGTDFTVLSGPKVGDELAPGESVTMVVRFTAPSSGGVSQGSYTVWGNDTTCDPPVRVTFTGGILGVAETSPAMNLRIDALQPNPAKSQITLLFHAQGPSVQLEIFDVLGKRVRSERLNVASGETTQEHVDLHELPKGSYILRMSSTQSAVSARFEIE